MTAFYKQNKAVLIQCSHTMPVFIEMNRLTYQRHAAYAISHGYDYWHHIGNPCPDRDSGAWDKVKLILQAMNEGYEYIVWVDCDAAILGDEDLREALAGMPGDIGACLHDANGIPAHLNVGVLYIKNTEKAHQFVQDWWDSFPGSERWMDQGAFNELSNSEKYAGLVVRVNDRFNATVNVNMVENPVVAGWHGVSPLALRLHMMRQAMNNDWLKFRV